MTEFFWPVLGVMPIRNLEDGIYQVNATGYGLTSGLESLDDREIAMWTEGIRAGNLYVNRSTTGAIVHRQPFGGMGKSAFGAGIKAGGPNYTAQFMRFVDSDSNVPLPQHSLENEFLRDLLRRSTEHVGSVPGLDEVTLARLNRAFDSYEAAFRGEFGGDHDDFMLLGQDNIRRYLPVPGLRIRISRTDTPFGILARVAGAMTVGCRPTLISHPAELEQGIVDRLDEWTESWGAAVEFLVETDEELAELVADGAVQRIRYARPDSVPNCVRSYGGCVERSLSRGYSHSDRRPSRIDVVRNGTEYLIGLPPLRKSRHPWDRITPTGGLTEIAG